MATATKQSKASKVRAYQDKHPSAGATQVAKACGTTPAYVYALRASDRNPTPKTPKQQWKMVHMTTSNEPKTPKKDWKTTLAETTRKLDEADRIFELTKGRDRVEMIEPQADNVNHPAHYKVGGIETIDFIEAKNLNYRLGNVVKYITRADSKGNRKEDLLKAQWYLNREIAAMDK